MEVADGIWLSLDDVEEDRCDDADVLDRVRERDSRRTGVRERFEGIPTGMVWVVPRDLSS